MDTQGTERLALVALLAGAGPMTPAQLRGRYDDTLSTISILEDTGVEPDQALEHAQALVESWESDGVTRLLTFLDKDYPSQLLDVYNFPPLIFTRGLLPSSGQRDIGVAIVGSREASAWATDAARDIAEGISRRGLTVVSGLAHGIDTAAHKATLQHNGRTVAIIGTGIQRTYPKENRALQQTIEERGLVISQFWPEDGPRRYSFPMRNVVMSAYSAVTLVVEASEKSGTRHQVTEAVRQGRSVILSQAVASNTTWGKKYGMDPLNNVYVSKSIEESISIAHDMTKDRVSALLVDP